jgi:XTP/dITP diphosphohydrolase
MNKLLIATKNPAKLKQLTQLLSNYKLKLITLNNIGITTDVQESELTFESNAILKAKTYYKLSNMPTLADDGGLEIQSLNGWPGIYSRRVWGPNEREATDDEAIKEVMQRMKDISTNKRQAKLVAVIALAMPNGTIHIGRGEVTGNISTTIGSKIIPGFPYHTIFIPYGEIKTISELESQGSNHDYLKQRKNAIIKLGPYLKKLEKHE